MLPIKNKGISRQIERGKLIDVRADPTRCSFEVNLYTSVKRSVMCCFYIICNRDWQTPCKAATENQFT